MTDPRPTLETPRGGMTAPEVGTLMHNAWVHGCLSFADGSYDSGGEDSDYRHVVLATAARLIRCRPDYVESEQPAPSGTWYRVRPDRNVESKASFYVGYWGRTTATCSEDIPHVAALMAKMEADDGA